MVKRSKVPFRRGRQLCIFCRGTSLSEEHLWPKWAQSILPGSPLHERFVISARKGVVRRRSLERQGRVHTTRFRKVCKTCNSGWMGNFEEKVRPFLERMIRGKRVFLSEEHQLKLAQYLTYKMMVADWMDDDPVIPAQAAHEFYESREIPASTYIYVFNCTEGRWLSAFRSEAISIALEADWRPGIGKNTKSFAIGFGSLFVFAVFSSQIDLQLEFTADYGARLWPPLSGLLTWPPRNTITSEGAEFVASSLRRMINEPNVRHVGKP